MTDLEADLVIAKAEIEMLKAQLADSQPENEPLICPLLSDAEVKQPCIEGPCPAYQPTNADRIRGMTDEELAKELTRNPPIPCRRCEYYNHKHANCGAPNDFVCVTRYAEALTLDWLKQPAKEEHHEVD